MIREEQKLFVVHADSSTTSDFLFEEARIAEGKEAFQTLPGSYDGAADTATR